MHFMHSKKLKQRAKTFSQKVKRIYWWPVILKKRKQGEMPLPSLGPTPSLNSTFLNGNFSGF